MPPDFESNQPGTRNQEPSVARQTAEGCPQGEAKRSQPRTVRLFIYGTLKRGGSNHHYMLGQRFIDVARTAPAYRLHDMGGFPGMVHATDNNGLSIEGEIWDVTDACLADLDVLEAIDEGEYVYEPVPLLAPFDRSVIMGYRYARPVVGCPDIGTIWPV